MGGRRCIIINQAAQIPTQAPESYKGRVRIESMLRTHLQNSAVAGELDYEPIYSQVKTILQKESPLSTVDLQALLDVLHAVPETD